MIRICQVPEVVDELCPLWLRLFIRKNSDVVELLSMEAGETPSIDVVNFGVKVNVIYPHSMYKFDVICKEIIPDQKLCWRVTVPMFDLKKNFFDVLGRELGKKPRRVSLLVRPAWTMGAVVYY